MDCQFRWINLVWLVDPHHLSLSPLSIRGRCAGRLAGWPPPPEELSWRARPGRPRSAERTSPAASTRRRGSGGGGSEARSAANGFSSGRGGGGGTSAGKEEDKKRLGKAATAAAAATGACELAAAAGRRSAPEGAGGVPPRGRAPALALAGGHLPEVARGAGTIGLCSTWATATRPSPRVGGRRRPAPRCGRRGRLDMGPRVACLPFLLQ